MSECMMNTHRLVGLACQLDLVSGENRESNMKVVARGGSFLEARSFLSVKPFLMVCFQHWALKGFYFYEADAEVHFRSLLGVCRAFSEREPRGCTGVWLSTEPASLPTARANAQRLPRNLGYGVQINTTSVTTLGGASSTLKFSDPQQGIFLGLLNS